LRAVVAGYPGNVEIRSDFKLSVTVTVRNGRTKPIDTEIAARSSFDFNANNRAQGFTEDQISILWSP
jgi:hypothetical protein